MDSQFQFLKECCDILQSSLLEEFMEKQHLVSKLNDTEKYLWACEFETRKRMNTMIDHLKVMKIDMHSMASCQRRRFDICLTRKHFKS
jgi:hypothetical protein